MTIIAPYSFEIVVTINPETPPTYQLELRGPFGWTFHGNGRDFQTAFGCALNAALFKFPDHYSKFLRK